MDPQFRDYYRKAIRNSCLWLALFLLLTAASALFLMLHQKYVGFAEQGEMMDVIRIIAFLVLIASIILAAVRINEVLRLKDEARGIKAEDRQKKARLIYALTLSFGALIFLTVLLYIVEPKFQLEIDRGLGSRVVFEKAIHSTADDPDSYAYTLCIVENREAVTVDVYDPHWKRWYYAHYSSKDARWSYNTVHIMQHRYHNGWIIDTWFPYYMVSARYLQEAGFSGTIEVDEPFYKDITVELVPCGSGFVQYAYSLVDGHGVDSFTIDVGHWWDLIEGQQAE